MPYGRATPIVLSEPERAELEGLARRRSAPQGLALRARPQLEGGRGGGARRDADGWAELVGLGAG